MNRFNYLFYNGRSALDNERKEENKRMKRFEIDEIARMGPVIVLSNEWENPIIAKVLSVHDDRYGIGFDIEFYDYLTDSKCYGSNTLIPFTMQKITALSKLNPDEICSLYFEGRYTFHEIYKKKDSPYREKNVVRTDLDDWISRLEVNGFFKEYPQYNKY